MKALLPVLMPFLIFCSCTQAPKQVQKEANTTFAMYSEAVKDTFHIQVQLPQEYLTHPDKHYPTVFLLDGNFYFPMLASTLHQYEQAGLLEPMILVGIGYSSFKTMDSLRVRDYLYPAPLPSDEMKADGGGQRFRQFITKALLPRIDSSFRTRNDNRCLLGHSFGGYFVLYSLLDQLEARTDEFQTFISASPTLWYNNFYLNRLPAALKARSAGDSLRIFVSAGALEDSVWNIKPVNTLVGQLQKETINGVVCKSNVYSHLGHMDVGVLSFVKGLQEFRSKTANP